MQSSSVLSWSGIFIYPVRVSNRNFNFRSDMSYQRRTSMLVWEALSEDIRQHICPCCITPVFAWCETKTSRSLERMDSHWIVPKSFRLQYKLYQLSYSCSVCCYFNVGHSAFVSPIFIILSI